MIETDFWRNAQVSVIGGGSWGSVLAGLAAKNVREVRIWNRNPEVCQEINEHKTNSKFVPELTLPDNISAYSTLKEVLHPQPQAIVWALPSKATRELCRQVAPEMKGNELLIHATKGIEDGTLKRVSEMIAEELPTRRIGVISGPNLAREIAKGEPASTVVASRFEEVIEVGKEIFHSEAFHVYGESDVVGVEWAGALKNILAIAAGALNALEMGWNTQAMLISKGLEEMVRFGEAMGAKPSTFLGMAGVGDLMATCSSDLSRNYRVGQRLAKGDPIEEILTTIGQTAEGVRTARSVYAFAQERHIPLPITQWVCRSLDGEADPKDVFGYL